MEVASWKPLAQADQRKGPKADQGKGKKAALGSDHLLLLLLPSRLLPASLSLAQPTLTLRPTQDSSLDTFRLEYLLPPVILISLIFNYGYNFRELTWAFSIWLESVAILPQLFMLQRTGEAETITTHYLAALGLYRGLYIPNWMYRWVFFLLFLAGRGKGDGHSPYPALDLAGQGRQRQDSDGLPSEQILDEDIYGNQHND